MSEEKIEKFLDRLSTPEAQAKLSASIAAIIVSKTTRYALRKRLVKLGLTPEQAKLVVATATDFAYVLSASATSAHFAIKKIREMSA